MNSHFKVHLIMNISLSLGISLIAFGIITALIAQSWMPLLLSVIGGTLIGTASAIYDSKQVLIAHFETKDNK